MRNNTFEDNGSHSRGVLYIVRMPNVEITDDNIFSNNMDEYDLNTKVISQFIHNGYYIKEYIQ